MLARGRVLVLGSTGCMNRHNMVESRMFFDNAKTFLKYFTGRYRQPLKAAQPSVYHIDEKWLFRRCGTKEDLR